METGGGSAIDWFYHEMGVRYSYQIKLRDTGSYGFLLPKDNIIPTGEEAFNAVKYFGDFLLGNKGIESTISPETYPAMDNAGIEDSADQFVEVEKEVEHVVEISIEDEVEDYSWELRRRRR